jgi:hypothetical protein
MLTAKPMSSELKRFQESLFQLTEKRELRPALPPEFMETSLLFDISLRLDLDQHLGRDQSAYLHH